MYTINNLRHDIQLKNTGLVASGSIYYYREHGRNGYQAIDLYRIDTNREHNCISFVIGGSSRECYNELRAQNKSGYIWPYNKNELTRIQAFELCKIAGIDFNDDFHTLNFEQCDILHIWAKITRYRKPKNANGSLGRYFFEHLKRNFLK